MAAESSNNDSHPWVNYFRDGLNILKNQPETDFSQPSTETDKLYMSIGERDLIEVAHPLPQDDSVLKRFVFEFFFNLHLNNLYSRCYKIYLYLRKF